MMRVLREAFWGYHDDPVLSFDFERFAAEAEDFILAIGFINFKFLEPFDKERVVFMCFEEPNGFFSPERMLCHNHIHLIDKVFTICPYTAEWSNAKFPGQKWTTSFIPFNEDLVPPPMAKEFDIVYAGSAHHGMTEILSAMKRVKGCYIFFRPGSQVTHVDVPYKDKLTLFAKSRVAIVHNLLFPAPVYVSGIMADNPTILRENKAFENLPKPGPAIMPQLKTRLFEAAFCRSLILCRRDPWNLIEKYFEPGKEFVYYDEGQLQPTLDRILANYDDYLPIVEAAFNKAMAEYTTRRYFEKNLMGLWK